MNISHEVLSKDEAYHIANMDGELCYDPAVYARDNNLTYYIAINTWYHQVADCDRWAASALLEFITRKGLLQTIKECDTDASRLVKGEEPISEIGKLITKVTVGFNRRYFGQDPEKNFSRDDLASCLQLLRYLKRFSPLHNDLIRDEGYKSFLENENYVKLKQRREYPRWLIRAIREEISEIVDWDGFLEEVSRMDKFDFSIPTGTTFEGYKTPEEKVNAIFSQIPEAAKQPFGLPWIYPEYAESTDSDTCKVLAVPKSYKAVRIIAMEPVVRQSYAQYIMRILSKFLPDCIDITDQTRNQIYAQIGSRTGSFATLDASNASDLISKTLFRSVFPKKVVELVDPIFSHYTLVGDRKRLMQMMSTAGHSLTFIFETLVYYGIAAAACRYCYVFTKHECKVFVYGDDVVISSMAAQTAIEFYSMLGLRINIEKSYISGPYRESCGEEYWNGINVSSTYYPRFPVIGSITASKSIQLGVRMYRDSYRGKIDDSTTMLVDLQKRLFGISYDASLFVWEVVKSARPKITSSCFGSICNDLWTAVDIAQPYNTTECRDRDRNIDIPSHVADLCATQKHSYASIQYKTPSKELDEVSRRNFEIYKYQSFLRTGPSYSDPLSELLRVSDPPMSEGAYRGKARLIWRYSY